MEFGIEGLDDPHNRDAGLAVPRDDGTVHGSRTAVARQQRGVHIDEAQRRQCQHVLGQDPAVRGDDAEVGLQAAKLTEKEAVLETGGLQDRQRGRNRARLDRRIGRLLAAPVRPIRLRHDTDDGMRRLQQGVERGNGKRRCAEKDDPDRTPFYHLPARDSLRIRRTITSRLMPRRRSTNNMPSR